MRNKKGREFNLLNEVTFREVRRASVFQNTSISPSIRGTSISKEACWSIPHEYSWNLYEHQSKLFGILIAAPLKKIMTTALERWTSKDEKRLNEILGVFDINSSPIQYSRNPNERLKVLGMDPDFPDDLSTIAGDTLAGTVHTLEASPRTPDKIKNDETDTQPETPPKLLPSSTNNSYNDEYERHRICSFCRLFTFAGCVGSILLGAIAVMSITLYQIRKEKGVSNNELPVNKPDGNFSKSPAFDFSDIEGDSLTPSPSQTYIPTNLSGDGQLFLHSIKENILSMVPDFYSNAESLSMDPTSVHYKVMKWLAEDPLHASYSPSRVVQRFALGVVYWSLTSRSTNLTTGWMTYTDECQWPQSRSSRSLCDSTGNVIAINLEDMDFDGILASEIGLLPNLEFLILKSNNLQGDLPTAVGLLTKLRSLNIPDNNIRGSIPTQIGLLENLSKCNNLLGQNLCCKCSYCVGCFDFYQIFFLSVTTNLLVRCLPK